MRNNTITILTFILCSATALAQGDLKEGLRWYNQRTSGAAGLKAKPEHINKAIAHFQKSMTIKEQELESGIYLMRCYIFKARFTQDSDTDKRKTFQLAKEIGDRLVPKYPISKELRFEYLSSLGQWGEVMGVFRAAKEGVVDKVKAEMEALIKLDPEFRNAVGERSLAVLNLRVPKIPFILSWPDKKKSLQMTGNILRRYPDDIGNNIYHAEALIENGREKEAITYLQRALSMQPQQEYLLEDRHFHLEAKQMLEKVKGN